MLGIGTGFVSSAVSIPIRITVPVPGHNQNPDGLGIPWVPAPSLNPDGLGIPWLPAPSQSQVDAFHNVMNTVVENITTSVMEYVRFLANPFRDITFERNTQLVRTLPQDFADVLARTGTMDATGQPFRFFSAFVSDSTDMLVPIDPLTLAGADAFIRGLPLYDWQRQGVLALTDADAQALLLMLDGSLDAGRFDRGRMELGHFPHYHPALRPNAHIWFLL